MRRGEKKNGCVGIDGGRGAVIKAMVDVTFGCGRAQQDQSGSTTATTVSDPPIRAIIDCGGALCTSPNHG